MYKSLRMMWFSPSKEKPGVSFDYVVGRKIIMLY